MNDKIYSAKYIRFLNTLYYIIVGRTIATIALGPYDFVLITYIGNSFLFRVNHDKINLHALCRFRDPLANIKCKNFSLFTYESQTLTAFCKNLINLKNLCLCAICLCCIRCQYCGVFSSYRIHVFMKFDIVGFYEDLDFLGFEQSVRGDQLSYICWL